jgi:TRAP-type C4-dicarboxylate transport system permease small subunit
MVRSFLNALYRLSGGLAALFLFGIGVVIVLQILGRIFDFVVDSTEIAGFFLAASSFLGLAYTLRHGSHIRVTMLLAVTSPKKRWLLEMWCCACAAVCVGFLSWHVVLFTMESYEFGDVSPGLAAIPFWIPQAGMALGLMIMTVALLDELLSIARGREPIYEEQADTALE